jgi:hypothetical protein
MSSPLTETFLPLAPRLALPLRPTRDAWTWFRERGERFQDLKADEPGLAIGPPSSARSPETVGGYRYSVVADSIRWFSQTTRSPWPAFRNVPLNAHRELEHCTRVRVAEAPCM